MNTILFGRMSLSFISKVKPIILCFNFSIVGDNGCLLLKWTLRRMWSTNLCEISSIFGVLIKQYLDGYHPREGSCSNCISCSRNFNCVTIGFCNAQKCSSDDFNLYTTDCGGNQCYLLIDVTQQSVDMIVNHLYSISSFMMVCTTISASKKLKKEKEQYEEDEQYKIQQDLGLPEEFNDNQDSNDEMKDNDDG
ncbi:hypothetical protein ACTA71_003191 [Dictyostelium dimigraforme]